MNTQSNHPHTVLNHITKSVNKRLNNISCNKDMFENAKGEYERALTTSGHNAKLTYYDENNISGNGVNKNHRKRKN